MDTRIVELEQRLARAERRLRGLSGLVLLGVIAGLLLLLPRTGETGAPGSTLRAPVRVVDSRGRALLTLDTGPLGTWHATRGTRLSVHDDQGRATAVLMASDDGGCLSLDSRRGKRSVGVFARQHGALLTFRNPSDPGIPAAVLQASSNGCSFRLYDQEGRPVASMPAQRGSGEVR
jgi:hypothetical protein